MVLLCSRDWIVRGRIRVWSKSLSSMIFTRWKNIVIFVSVNISGSKWGVQSMRIRCQMYWRQKNPSIAHLHSNPEFFYLVIHRVWYKLTYNLQKNKWSYNRDRCEQHIQNEEETNKTKQSVCVCVCVKCRAPRDRGRFRGSDKKRKIFSSSKQLFARRLNWYRVSVVPFLPHTILFFVFIFILLILDINRT